VAADFVFTTVIMLGPRGAGAKYTAIALHRDQAEREKHAQMGFHEDWSAALDQLAALARTL
jgi:hypothetical protein